MIKVGITGGIGSGKTTVCKVFEMLGTPVYSADEEAKKIVDDDKTVQQSIITIFGNDVLNNEKKVDRKKLASIVFNDKEKLQQLNNVVHPAVAKHFEDWLLGHPLDKYILKEAAILFESGAYKAMNKIIAVVAPLELKIERVMQRDKSTRMQVEERIHNQMSDEKIIEKSNFVIHNDEQQLLILQIIAIHKQLVAM
jgi:dephospho-CoA kinase